MQFLHHLSFSATLVESFNCLMTSSSDCTVRLWTLEGHFIGTFGQPLKWDIYDSLSYQHPMAPYDVLMDPASIPKHPVLDDDDDDDDDEDDEDDRNQVWCLVVHLILEN